MRLQSILSTFLFALLAVSGSAQDSLNVNLFGRWFDNTLPPSADFNNTYNEVWGFVENGTEYAVIGSTMGTHIIDVTNASSLQEVDFVPGKDPGPHIVHRDYHDYDGYLYMVAQEGQSSLKVADLSYLPDSVHVVYDSDSLIVGSHNIFIDSSQAMLYACFVVVDNSLTMLRAISLADPENPVFVTDYFGIPEVHDFYVEDGIMYANGGPHGFFVVDFNDPLNPQMLGTMTQYPQQGYNHSGWTTPDDYYYLADENHGLELKVVDISDPSDISVLNTFGSGVDPASIAHNLIVKGDLLYVSYYHDGLWIYDISNRTQPTLAGFYDTYPLPDHVSYRGAWGVYPFLPSGKILVSDMQSGLFVFEEDFTIGTVEHEAADQQLDIFPNPSDEGFYLRTSLPQGATMEVTVSDATGRTIWSENRPNQSANRFEWPAEIPAGMYFISVRNSGYLQVQSLIKH